MIYVENAEIVNIRQNDLNPPGIGCKLVGTPIDSTARNILLDRNRLGVPALVTEYNGNTVSLIYHLSCYLPAFWKFPGMGTDLLPYYDASYALGSPSKRFTNLYLWGNIKEINAVEHELDPAADDTYALGNSGLKWSDVQTVLLTASGTIYGGNVNTGGVYKKGGLQVVGAQQAAIVDVSVAGSAQDADARTKINSVLAALRAHGLIAP
jgi:hypothetical protein